MLIRRVNKQEFDVFGNQGFDSWSRVRKFHWGYKVVKGVQIPRDIMKYVMINIENHPKGCLENL